MCAHCQILDKFPWVHHADLHGLESDGEQVTIYHSYPDGIDIASLVRSYLKATFPGEEFPLNKTVCVVVTPEDGRARATKYQAKMKSAAKSLPQIKTSDAFRSLVNNLFGVREH